MQAAHDRQTGKPASGRKTSESPAEPSASNAIQKRMQRFWRGLGSVCVFVLLTIVLWMLCGWVLAGAPGVDDRFALSLFSLLPAVLASTMLFLRLPRPRPLAAIGLPANRGGVSQLGLGVAFGGGLVLLIVGAQAAAGWVVIEYSPLQDYAGPIWDPPLVLGVLAIAAGSAGEELLFRGYGFQQLTRATSPGIAIAATSVLFGIVHHSNPEFSDLSLLNTVLFGALFGIALVWHRTLWLPYGMHAGWNFTLAALGANLSGLKIKLTALTVSPAGPSILTGGPYGPEASVLTTFAVLAAALVLWKLPADKPSGPLLWD